MSKVLVVTGGSRGIGAATARLGAVRGYAVCIAYLRHEAAARGVVEEISAGGGRAMAVAATSAWKTTSFVCSGAPMPTWVRSARWSITPAYWRRRHGWRTWMQGV